MNVSDSLDGACELTHWGLMRASGADAASFLQGQLTADVLNLDGSQARPAGFCSAKGRLQASFVVLRPEPDEFLLACSADLLPATLKRLSMFVLRARCRLSDASTSWRITGVVGAGTLDGLAGASAWARVPHEAASWIRLPDVAGKARAWHVAPADVPADAGCSLALDRWRWLEVGSGLPIIEAATVDQFVPQMVNLELLGGVDFRKGCYPGQEVVARSQYRGTLKRRMFLFDVDASATAGQEVFHDADPDQPAGRVVNAAPRPDGAGSSALVEVKLAALGSGILSLSAPGGPPLTQRVLPYDVPYEAVAPA